MLRHLIDRLWLALRGVLGMYDVVKRTRLSSQCLAHSRLACKKHNNPLTWNWY